MSVNIINDEIFEVTELFSALLTLPGTPADRVAVHPALAEVSILDDDSMQAKIDYIPFETLNTITSLCL